MQSQCYNAAILLQEARLMVNAITDNGYFYVLLVFTAAFAIVSAALYFSKKRSAEYDERQNLVRGAAYGSAFWTVIAYFTVAAFASCRGYSFLLSVPGVYTGIFLALTVFAEICICRDAYFALSEKPTTYLIIGGICFAGFTAWGIRSVAVGGSVNEISVSFTIAAFFLILSVSLIVRTVLDKRAERLEADSDEES